MEAEEAMAVRLFLGEEVLLSRERLAHRWAVPFSRRASTVSAMEEGLLLGQRAHLQLALLPTSSQTLPLPVPLEASEQVSG